MKSGTNQKLSHINNATKARKIERKGSYDDEEKYLESDQQQIISEAKKNMKTVGQ